MALFSDAHLAELRTGYATITGIDPCQPTYGKITAMLDAMDDAQIVQIAKAEIKFLSLLATNRVIRRGLTL